MIFSDLLIALNNLNNAQRGSLGEYIFYHENISQGLKIESMHEQRVDFIINGTIQVDVKTTFSSQQASLKNKSVGVYSGTKYDGIQYALVEMLSDGIRISIDGILFSEITLDQVKKYWESWKGDKSEFTPQQHQKGNGFAIVPIRDKIETYFKKTYALNARVIYRTVQKAFRKESPDNLVPKFIKPQNITVYIDFCDKRIALDNINRIIAFPDTCSIEFPKIKKPALHLEKIDIDALDEIYKFRNVEELLADFAKRFLNNYQVL